MIFVSLGILCSSEFDGCGKTQVIKVSVNCSLRILRKFIELVLGGHNFKINVGVFVGVAFRDRSNLDDSKNLSVGAVLAQKSVD